MEGCIAQIILSVYQRASVGEYLNDLETTRLNRGIQERIAYWVLDLKALNLVDKSHYFHSLLIFDGLEHDLIKNFNVILLFRVKLIDFYCSHALARALRNMRKGFLREVSSFRGMIFGPCTFELDTILSLDIHGLTPFPEFDVTRELRQGHQRGFGCAWLYYRHDRGHVPDVGVN